MWVGKQIDDEFADEMDVTGVEVLQTPGSHSELASPVQEGYLSKRGNDREA